MLRSSSSVTMGSPGLRHSPSSTLASSMASPAGGPRNSPSITSMSRVSPNVLNQVTRSSSPAMQASSAGLNVTLGGPSPSFSSLSGLQNTISSMGSTTNNMFGLYTQPTTYASTNPFLTGAYMSYNTGESSYSDKYNTIGSTKDIKNFFESYSSDSPNKYPTKLATTYESDSGTNNESMFSTGKYNTIGSKYPDQKPSYLSSGYSGMESKYSPNKDDTFEGNQHQSNNSGLLHVEETPTPTSSIETEDSNTREVGEKDVEGDGEQSD